MPRTPHPAGPTPRKHGAGGVTHERKLFGTDGIRGVANEHPMTPELALQLGRAVAFVAGRGKSHVPRVVLGKDARVIASGGMSPVVAAETNVIEVVEGEDRHPGTRQLPEFGLAH